MQVIMMKSPYVAIMLLLAERAQDSDNCISAICSEIGSFCMHNEALWEGISARYCQKKHMQLYQRK